MIINHNKPRREVKGLLEKIIKNQNIKIASLFFLILVISAIFYGRPYIESDGYSYYALTESLVKDGDFNLSNQQYLDQWCSYAVIYHGGTERYVSSYAGGFAIMYAPFLFMFSYLHDSLGFLTQFDPYSLQLMGIPFVYSLSIFIGSIFFSFLTLFIIYAILKDYFKKQLIILSIVLMYISTLLAYSVTFPSFLHVVETVLITLSFYIFIKRDKIIIKNYDVSYYLLGISVGFVSIVRNIDAVLAFPYILYFGYKWGYQNKKYKKLITILVKLTIGVLPFFVFSMYYNNIQYGSPFGTGYFGAGVLDPLPYYILNYLFDPIRGIFIWAPLTILAVIGFRYLHKINKELSIISISSFAFALFAFGFYNRWWAGLCFGQRYLTMLFPFFVCGLTAFLSNNKKSWRYIAVALAIFSLILLNVYMINMHTPDGNGLLLSEHYTPMDLMKTSYISYITEHQTTYTGSAHFLINRIFGGNEPTILYGLINLLRGNGPSVIEEISLLSESNNTQYYNMVIHAYSEKGVQVGIDIWDKNNPIHPEGHLAWFVSQPFVIHKGKNNIKIRYTPGDSAQFDTGDGWKNSQQGWISEFSEIILSNTTVLDVHGTLFSDGNVLTKNIEYLHTPSQKQTTIQTKVRVNATKVALFDNFPSSDYTGNFWDMDRWGYSNRLVAN